MLADFHVLPDPTQRQAVRAVQWRSEPRHLFGCFVNGSIAVVGSRFTFVVFLNATIVCESRCKVSGVRGFKSKGIDDR